MNISYNSLIKQEDFINETITKNGSTFNEYLHDSNLTVTNMIKKYDISTLENNQNEKKKYEKKDLRCTVCGARAFGYNFDQITCESCKAFFRRNALKNMTELHCRADGNCNITLENRRHCTYCRIKKCFSIGMRKEWIRSEEEKNIKRTKLEVHRKFQQSKKSLQMPIMKNPNDISFKTILSSMDRMRLNNVTHCYDQYTGEPSINGYCAPKEFLFLNLHDFYNRKKPIIVNFVNYFKHLPEFQQLHVDDQVLLIKRNLHFLLPINYALLKTPIHSQFRYTKVQTIGCIDNTDLHSMYQVLSNNFVPFVASDALVIKLLTITLFFTTNSQAIDIDTTEYKQLEHIKRVQSSYIELLWLYMYGKYGEVKAIKLFSKIITKVLHLQFIMDRIDTVIRLNNDIQYLDSLMKTILQLT
ncbi:unnamed protein product [Adineta steineri]|uniref:Uncharacterized protein n=1 Tax=Adineta steineri TaxID=433720 RepID=A0A819SNJ3_9BILA|nr:unnamed protein product [Adineta steineri]CAF4065759.1 unnamed protein product [Adineta steineri]